MLLLLMPRTASQALLVHELLLLAARASVCTSRLLASRCVPLSMVGCCAAGRCGAAFAAGSSRLASDRDKGACAAAPRLGSIPPCRRQWGRRGRGRCSLRSSFCALPALLFSLDDFTDAKYINRSVNGVAGYGSSRNQERWLLERPRAPTALAVPAAAGGGVEKAGQEKDMHMADQYKWRWKIVQNQSNPNSWRRVPPLLMCICAEWAKPSSASNSGHHSVPLGRQGQRIHGGGGGRGLQAGGASGRGRAEMGQHAHAVPSDHRPRHVQHHFVYTHRSVGLLAQG